MWGVLPSILLIGFLSMLFAEVFAGSSQMWFVNGWGIFFTFPLYLAHVLFFLWIALKIKKISLPQLYLFGVIFALYESWITKVLWAGYLDQAGPAMGTIAGIGISEFSILVFFWHSIMSFIVPILVFEILTGQIFKEHSMILKKSAKKTKFIILFLILISTFIAMGNKYNLISTNLSLIGTLLLILGLYYSTKKSNLKVFEFSKIGFAITTVYLLLLYIGTFFFLLPERIPHTPMPYISIILFYAFCIFIIRKSKRIDTEFQQLEEDHYSIDDLKKFALIIIISVNIAVIVPTVSMFILAVTYFILALTGTILFISVVYKTLK